MCQDWKLQFIGQQCDQKLSVGNWSDIKGWSPVGYSPFIHQPFNLKGKSTLLADELHVPI